MATKPLVQPELWASNALYTTGPFIGSISKVVPAVAVAAEGHRPGSLFPTAAEHENSQQNTITQLARWVFLGTSAATLSASIVERDATGRPSLHGLNIANTLDEIALNITGVSITTPVVLATAATGTTIFQADPGAGAGTCYAASTNAGAATGVAIFMTGSPSAAFGLHVISDGGAPIHVENTGLSRSLRIDHSGASTEAALIDSTSATARGLRVTVAGVVEAILGESGLVAGNAIRAFLRNDAAFGLYATTPGTSTTTARAVRAQASGDGTGIEATAVDGDGGRFASSGTGGSAIYCPGRATDPTVTFDGHVDFNTTTQTWVHSDQDASNYRDIWSSRGGLIIGADVGNVITSSNSLVYELAATLALTGQNAPHRPNTTIVLTFSCGARSVLSFTNTIDVLIQDTTAGVDVAERVGEGPDDTDGFFLPVATTSWQQTITWEVQYVVPLAGDRTFTVSVKTATANSIEVRDVCLKTYGAITAA